MRKSSWEIIIAGLFFIGVAAYISTNNSAHENTATAAHPDSIKVFVGDEQTHVIELNNFENLKNLSKVEKLEKLKALATYLPAEVKIEFIDEINTAIHEFDREELDVHVDVKNGLISIDKAENLSSGKWNNISPGVFAYIKEFDASSIEEAEMKLPYGSITVVGTNGNEGKLTIQASGKISSQQDLESKLKALSVTNNSQARFEVKRISPNSSDENIHLQAVLNLPRNTAVTMATKAGHIESESINGNQMYSTQGGHINLEQLKGDIEARTAGGHITIKKSQGNLNLQSSGGHIRAIDSEGKIFMKTSGGNLHAQNTSGELQATTNGGNIEIRLLDISGNADAQTGAGSINIWIPKHANADVDLSGNSVELAPALHFEGEKTSGYVKGSLNNGGATIKAKTSYGKVVLKQSNN